MSWFVYVLKSISTGKFYVGMSQNLEQRLAAHNAGKSKFTSAYRPWELVYWEAATDINTARSREKYLKSAAGRRFIKKRNL